MLNNIIVIYLQSVILVEKCIVSRENNQYISNRASSFGSGRLYLFCSFPHSWLIIGLVTKLTPRVPLVEQELFNLPEHLSSPPVFSGVRITPSLVLCICFVDRSLSFCIFSFGHCSVLLRHRVSNYSFSTFKHFLIYNVYT